MCSEHLVVTSAVLEVTQILRWLWWLKVVVRKAQKREVIIVAGNVSLTGQERGGSALLVELSAVDCGSVSIS